MFAYCGNNPVNYADPTGEFGWLALITAMVVSRGVTALVEFATGGSAGEVGKAFLKGALSGGLVYWKPWTTWLILVFDMTKTYSEHRNEGYSISDSAAAASTNVVSSISPFQTNDLVVDQVSQAVFGSGFSLTAFGLEQIVLGRERPSGQEKIRNQQQFQNHVYSGLMIMGCLGSSRYTCYANRGDCYVRL